MKKEKTPSKAIQTARFDARLSQEQKALFEQAAKLKGFKSLSEFVIQTTQEAAQAIIEKHQTILSSEKDRKVFFNALLHPPKPNAALTKAARSYQRKVSAS